jgi:hypothetical protein
MDWPFLRAHDSYVSQIDRPATAPSLSMGQALKSLATLWRRCPLTVSLAAMVGQMQDRDGAVRPSAAHVPDANSRSAQGV